ncbi:TipAS antibiotic-recognition domain-containing protein [Leucobacter sp. USCH14]|uniref:MerR family transcriptional regulator n=1 Tax=Leucobacter sp. USCH14 TaxID=3024838 RepID=UPI0030A5D076
MNTTEPVLHSVQAVARAAGTTSRTLRHYDRVGLLPPTLVGANGYRYYDDRALLRLQRILLLRELGLGLDAIARVLAAQDAHGGAEADPDRDAPSDEAEILQTHLAILHGERERLARQIAAVERTIAALQDTTETSTTRGALMSENIFDGFDHARHREEVEKRWGARAYAESDRWWNGLDAGSRTAWQKRTAELGAAWAAAAERGCDPAGAEAQGLAARHVDWLRDVPGTPAADPDGDIAGYVRGLGELYVADQRFAANYGGQAGAEFVREALRVHADTALAEGAEATD